jgi:hypothetical protein
MPTDPFVAPDLEDRPRQETNLAPGVHMPPAQSWVPNRPGDDVATGQPVGPLLGRPGPNIGYALTLGERLRGGLALAPHEGVEDVLAVVSELAMKRAASYGRAPVMTDLEIAARLLGYQGDVDPQFAGWRASAIHGASHYYETRRSLVDAVPDAILRLPPQVPALVDDFRGELQQTVVPHE